MCLPKRVYLNTDLYVFITILFDLNNASLITCCLRQFFLLRMDEKSEQYVPLSMTRKRLRPNKISENVQRYTYECGTPVVS